jgi:hypothetical protein
MKPNKTSDNLVINDTSTTSEGQRGPHQKEILDDEPRREAPQQDGLEVFENVQPGENNPVNEPMGIISLGRCFESLERSDGGVSETNKGADQLVKEANGNKEESQEEARQENMGGVDASFLGKEVEGEQITELRFEVSLKTEIAVRQVVNKRVVGGRSWVSML